MYNSEHNLFGIPVQEFDIYKSVDNWYSNIHYGHNPKSILLKEEDFSSRWIELFSYPYLDQSNDNFEANPDWLKAKKDFLSGSEVGAALGVGWDTSEQFVQYKSGKKEKIFPARAQIAMKHGKIKEDIAGLRYTYEVDDITFKFGLIPHQDKKWSFLGVSPDLIRFYKERPVEIKSPYSRRILDMNKLDKDVKVLIRDVLLTGERHKYLSITNLPISYTNLLDKYIDYYHQCQLQAEVLDIGDYIDFTQFGCNPNPFCLNSDIVTITEIPRDKNWIQKYGDQLRKVWDEVLYYRGKNDKKRKIEYISDEENICPF